MFPIARPDVKRDYVHYDEKGTDTGRFSVSEKAQEDLNRERLSLADLLIKRVNYILFSLTCLKPRLALFIAIAMS